MRGSLKNKRPRQRILVVAAHPDDEVLGCGGTMARYAREGHAVFSLILGQGVESRNVDQRMQSRQIRRLLKESDLANQVLGVRKVYRYSFPDNKFDSVPLLEIVKAIEAVKRMVGPRIVFTHHAHDVNIDHQITFKASLAAFRPLPGEHIQEFYSFYVQSSTDWQSPAHGLVFSPTSFVNVTSTIQRKVRALQAHKSEIRDYPHPRSAKGVLIEAERTGLIVGLEKAEAFELIRSIRF